jgi:aldehyde:ferredoxin oxidoreductase
MDGYAGKIAFIDLTRGKVQIQPTPADLTLEKIRLDAINRRIENLRKSVRE